MKYKAHFNMFYPSAILVMLGWAIVKFQCSNDNKILFMIDDSKNSPFVYILILHSKRHA